MEQAVGVRWAAERLTRLLAEPRYRRRWQRFSNVRRGEVPRAAVAAVLADHLVDTGEAAADLRPRSLENRVGRALNGDRLSDRTLELFIAAFEMSDEHAEELRTLRRGRPAGDRLVVAGAPTVPRPVPRRTVRTLQVAEHHEIGADRSPCRHVTRQLLEALEETSRYHYAFDTVHAAVAVRTGGVPVDAWRVTGTPLCVVEILLAEPLLPGQATHLEYETLFAYPEPPAPEFRRGVTAGVRHLALTVRFHPASLPREVWRCRWPDVAAAEPSSAVPVPLVGGQTALEVVPDGDCVFGYRWRW
ncbi:hypothetical protein A7K94_0211145 [Modestobacter sp. VKM Ac-2676]|nr:hypothetical protein A7K94_0211145 [Modestobacter sp. VKM Ac-2676]